MKEWSVDKNEIKLYLLLYQYQRKLSDVWKNSRHLKSWISITINFVVDNLFILQVNLHMQSTLPLPTTVLNKNETYMSYSRPCIFVISRTFQVIVFLFCTLIWYNYLWKYYTGWQFATYVAILVKAYQWLAKRV